MPLSYKEWNSRQGPRTNVGSINYPQRQLARNKFVPLGPLRFGGLVVEQLASAKSSTELVFGGLVVEVLGTTQARQGVNFGGLVRETLALYLPSKVEPGITTYDYGPIPTFPTLPEGFPVKVGPVLDTIIGTTKSLREMRSPMQTYPIWDIEILFEELLDQTQNQTPYTPFAGYQQYMDLVQLWLMMYGQTGVFLFTCPWDCSRANQAVGTGDGSTQAFILYRTWGTGAQATESPIGGVNTITAVYINGTPVSSSTYIINRNVLTFLTAPASGAVITITFSYYYLCRFTEDEQDFEEFAKNRWTVNNLKMRASPW